jgi:hypothetical protein
MVSKRKKETKKKRKRRGIAVLNIRSVTVSQAFDSR